MEKPIAIVQHEKSVPGGLVTEVLDRRGVDHVIVESWTDTDWPEARDLAALVVMGGTMNVDQLDDYPFLKLSRQLMTDAISEEVPVLGVCLGSQMLARVLGAEVGRCDPRNVSFAPLDISTEGLEDPLVANFESVPVLQFHEDTFDLPTGAVPLAKSSSNRTHQAFRYGTRPMGSSSTSRWTPRSLRVGVATSVPRRCEPSGVCILRTSLPIPPSFSTSSAPQVLDWSRSFSSGVFEVSFEIFRS